MPGRHDRRRGLRPLLAGGDRRSIAGSDRAHALIVANPARVQPATIGHIGAFRVEVVAGLSEGNTVVRHPTDEVRGGARVAAR